MLVIEGTNLSDIWGLPCEATAHTAKNVKLETMESEVIQTLEIH